MKLETLQVALAAINVASFKGDKLEMAHEAKKEIVSEIEKIEKKEEKK